MDRISKFIVRYRNKILLVAVLLLIPSVIGYLNTGINYDILSYLPKEAESMKGQEVLDKDFNLASVGMMVTNDLSDKEVVSLKDKIEKIEVDPNKETVGIGQNAIASISSEVVKTQSLAVDNCYRRYSYFQSAP